MGSGNTASGQKSVAIGWENQASGYGAVSIGSQNHVSGLHSYAFGFRCIVDADHSTVIGKHNKILEKPYAFVVGNGTNIDDENRSNALTLDWDGNLWTAGDVTATDSDGNNVSLCETARIMRDSLGMIKSKNLLKNTAGTTTQNGITFTYNDDGSVTCNGTATADTNYIYTVTLPQNASFILSVK